MTNAVECPRCGRSVPGEPDSQDTYFEDHSYVCKRCQSKMKFVIVERVDPDWAVGRLEEIH